MSVATPPPPEESHCAMLSNEPTTPTVAGHAAVPRAIHFVLLHHGYHGCAQDFHYLCHLSEKALRERNAACRSDAAGRSAVAPPRYVFILPRGSDGLKTDDGIWACAYRYTEVVCRTVAATMAQVGWDRCARPACPDAAAAAPMCELHFGVVGHSMGGLVLRAALPELMQRLEAAHGPHAALPCTLHWDVFCTLGTPHLGVQYTGSRVMTFLGHHVGCHLMTSVADLLLKTNVIGCDLVSDASLSAWARFRRRVLINVVNDGTVLTHSSSFVVPLHVLRRVGAPLPPNTAITPTNSRTPAETSAPLRPNSHSTSDWTSNPEEDTVLHLAQHGITCASSREELQKNAVVVDSVSPLLWPLGVLPDARALAEVILRRVGPLELHLVDFRPTRERLVRDASISNSGDGNQMGILSRAMTHLAVTHFSHAATVCKQLFSYPDIFGFVSEYIAENLLGVPLSDTARTVARLEAEESEGGAAAAVPNAAEAAALAMDFTNA